MHWFSLFDQRSTIDWIDWKNQKYVYQDDESHNKRMTQIFVVCSILIGLRYCEIFDFWNKKCCKQQIFASSFVCVLPSKELSLKISIFSYCQLVTMYFEISIIVRLGNKSTWWKVPFFADYFINQLNLKG